VNLIQINTFEIIPAPGTAPAQAPRDDGRAAMKLARLALLSAALLAAVSPISGCSKSGSQLEIGAILPLTGDGAKYGEEARKAIDLALEETSKDKIRVAYEDDLGTSAGAVNAFSKLTANNKLPAVIGPMFSSTALAIAPIADRKHVVVLSPSASSPALTTAGDYFFRNWPSDTFEGSEMARYARKDLGLARVAILAVNLDYGLGLEKVFRQKFEAEGGKITATESYDQGATDFRTQLSKIAATNPEAIYLPGYYAEIGLALRQARELGIRTTFLSSVGFDDPKVLEIAGNAADGVIFARPYYDPESGDPLVKNFVANFTKKYGNAPGVYAAHAYDALRILYKAIESGGTAADDIKSALYKIKDFPGVTGATSFDGNGDVIKPIQIMKVENGAFKHVH
jgi:branched-chain amino acid transport system substrate-binding protein